MLAHHPRRWLKRHDDALRLPGVPAYVARWPAHDLVAWPATATAETAQTDLTAALALPAHEGGVWTGVVAAVPDGFPFVGPAPARAGHFLAAGFGGHGMPRILLATAQLVPAVLASLAGSGGVAGAKTGTTTPPLVAGFPPLPGAFVVTAERVARWRGFDVAADVEAEVRGLEASAAKAFCVEARGLAWETEG